jgi:hypothetical protein
LIRIRYSDLPAGLHARVEARGGTTTIYLLPGLTAAQRRAALQRARRSASMGYGPLLPASGVAVAVILDQIRATLRNGAVAVRAHPLLFVPVIVVLSAASVYVMSTAVTITIRQPQAAAQAPQPGGMPGVGQSDPAAAAEPGRNGGAAPAPGGSGGSPTGTPTGSPPPGRHHSPVPSPSHSPSPTSTPSPGPPASPSPSVSVLPPTPSASPSPSPAPSSSGSCLDVGPLGICLNL